MPEFLQRPASSDHEKQCGESGGTQPGMMSENVVKSRFRPDRLARLSQLERWHFWFVGRRVLLDRLLDKYLRHQMRILDVGCGTGLMPAILTRRGYHVVGLDLRPEGLRATRQVLPGANLIQAEATRLPLAENQFAAVLLLDVLEHVDDQALLREVRRVLQPRGVVVMTAPALPWLWSYRDEAAGHLRRYTRQRLERIIADSQLEAREIRYYQCFLLPVVIMTRVLGRQGAGPRDLEERPLPILNAVMSWINRLEARLSEVISWPWGSSLVAVGRKI